MSTVLRRLGLIAMVAGVVPVVMLGECCEAQEAQVQQDEYVEVDSAARMDIVLRKAAMGLQTELKVRPVGGWARTARDMLRKCNWYNWVASYSYLEREENEGRSISFNLAYKDSTRMLAAVRNPALRKQLNATENRALEVVEKVLHKIIKPGMTDMDKIQAVHDWIINRTTYDKREPSSHLATTLLLRGKGICDAYSRATWLMLNMLDIPCLCVLGDAGGPHVWNLVYAQQQWFHLDVTWDDPICQPEIISHGFFCLSDREMWDTHKWNRRLYPPTEEGKPFYYRQRNRYFRKVDADLWKSARAAYDKGDESYEAYVANLGSREKLVQQIESVSKGERLPILNWTSSKGKKGVLRLTFASHKEKSPTTPPKETLFEVPKGAEIDGVWIRDLFPEGGEWSFDDFGMDVEEVKKKGVELMEKGGELWNGVKGMWP